MARTPVKVQLDRERTLKYTLNSLCLLEEKTNGVAIGPLLKTGQMANLRLVFWAGLIHDDPTLTPEQAGDLIDFADLNDLIEHKVSLALGQQAAIPTRAGAEAAAAPATASAPTGIPSGLSADTIWDSQMVSSGV